MGLYVPGSAPSTASPVSVTAGASPYTYQNTSGSRQNIIVTGGTVTLVEYSRGGTVWFTTGLIAGTVLLNPNDSVRVTYTVAPVMTAVPI